MRVADSQRIKAMKLLAFETAKERFDTAKKLYLKAIENYNESILYDDVGNPSVFHKKGFTLLLLPEPDLHSAENSFKDGIRLKKNKVQQEAQQSPPPPKDETTPAPFKKDKQDLTETDKAPQSPTKPTDPGAEARTDEEIQLDNDLGLAEEFTRKDEDFALMNCGLGLVHFMRGVREIKKEEEEFRVAIKYFRYADKLSRHPSYVKKAGGVINKILVWFDLDEIVEPVPHAVLLARLHNYRARKLIERGQEKLAENALANAQDALDLVKVFYSKDARFFAEQADIHFLRKEPTKCLSVLAEIEANRAPQCYSDIKFTGTLKAKALIQGNKYDEALAVVNDLLDRESGEVQSLVLRAQIYSIKKMYKEASDDVDSLFAKEANKQNLYLLMETGDIYMTMGGAESNQKAKSYYIQAFYLDPKNIRINYLLGKAYQAVGDASNMRECFQRVVKIDPSSSYGKDAMLLLGAP